MPLIVEQTLPYTHEQLRLDNPQRWARLFPLIRPSITVVESTHGEALVLDTALVQSQHVLLAAIGTTGNFSNKILSESHLAAFTTEMYGRPAITADEIVEILKDKGFPTQNGVVVVRSGSSTDIRVWPGLLELVVVGELKFDHILSLLSATKPATKESLGKTRALLEHFVNSVARTTSIFHEKKTGKGPSVIHAIEMAEFSNAKATIAKDMGYILSSLPSLGGEVVYSIHFSDINGLSHLEINILAHEISEYLAGEGLSSHISHSTIVNYHNQARGWSISLCAVPKILLSAQTKPTNTLAITSASTPSAKPRIGTSKIQFSDSQVRKIITAGCESVIKNEPKITEYDTIVGDGDCGYTLRDGATQVLKFISTADLSALPSALSSLVDDLEINMGGTSGALYCIFLSALSQQLSTASNFPKALEGALKQLLKYTKARLGDRTCLDCLIPFTTTLKHTGDKEIALENAKKGVERTMKMEATLGRSSYLDESVTRGVPDPGAYGLLKLLEGMVG